MNDHLCIVCAEDEDFMTLSDGGSINRGIYEGMEIIYCTDTSETDMKTGNYQNEQKKEEKTQIIY